MGIQMTGMASGLDTKSIVESMLQTEKSKVDRINQKKQILEWRQEVYREFISTVRDFSKKYFDPLNKETYIMGSTALSGIKATPNVDKTVANIVATGSASPGNYELKVNKLAHSAKVQGSNTINQSTVKGDLKIPIVVSEKNNTIKIDEQTITLDSKAFENTSSLAKAINAKIQETEGTKDKYEVSVNEDGKLEVNSKVKIEEENATMKIKVGDSSEEVEITLSKGSYTADGLANEIKSELKKKLSSEESKDINVEVKEDGQVYVNDKPLDGEQYKFKKPTASVGPSEAMELDGSNILKFEPKFVKDKNAELVISVRGQSPVVIDLSGVDTSKPNEDIKKQISDKINEKSSETKIKSEVVNGKLVFKTDSKEQIVISGSAAKSIGIEGSLDMTLDIKTEKMTSVLKFEDQENKKVEFTINGEKFKYDFGSKEDKDGYVGGQDLTMRQVFADISNRAGVNITYNTISRSFTMESRETGKEVKLEAQDTSGKFLESLFGKNQITAQGGDAEVEFSDGDGNKNTFGFSSNNFTLSGINFDIKTMPTEPIKVSVITDMDKTVELMKGFVEDFNKIMDDLNTKTKERPNSKYKPLTEAQKEEMSEKEIELWEKKAKEGIVGNESDLENFMYALRNAIFTPVKGAKINLQDIGLDTSNDYREGGKIKFDEEKFREALAKNPEGISELFTKTTDSKYDSYDPDLTADQRKERNADLGIFRRINDVLSDYTRTTRNSNGKKGIFIEIAGLKGDSTFTSNTLSKEMQEYDKRIDNLNSLISKREERYYAQFSRLETALTKLQSQSAIFGGQTM